MIAAVVEPQKIRRSGNSYVVTIPADVVERYGLREHDLVRVQLQLLDVVPRLRPELEESADRIIEQDIEALRYLANH